MATKKTTTEKKEVAAEMPFLPRLTEKASLQSAANAYTFTVPLAATKLTIREAIMKTYKVSPRKVTLMNVKGKAVFVRGKFGETAAQKKAIVFLKKGDTIKIA